MDADRDRFRPFSVSAILILLYVPILYCGYLLLRLVVAHLNRVPNLADSRFGVTIGWTAVVLAAVVAALLALTRWMAGASANRRCGIGGWLLAFAFVAWWMPLPISLLGELACYAGAALFAAFLLRIAMDAGRLRRFGGSVLARILVLAAIALGFAILGLLMAKHLAMEFRMD